MRGKITTLHMCRCLTRNSPRALRPRLTCLVFRLSTLDYSTGVPKVRMTASRLRARRHAVRRVVATRSSGGFVRRAPPRLGAGATLRLRLTPLVVRLDEVQLLRVVPERLEISRVHPSHRRARRSHLFAVVHRRVEALVEPVSRRDGVLAAPARDEISVSTKPVPRRDVPRRRPRPRHRWERPASPACRRRRPTRVRSLRAAPGGGTAAGCCAPGAGPW